MLPALQLANSTAVSLASPGLTGSGSGCLSSKSDAEWVEAPKTGFWIPFHVWQTPAPEQTRNQKPFIIGDKYQHNIIIIKGLYRS